MTDIEIAARGIRAKIALRFGMITVLVTERDGQIVSMLHKAPWLGQETPAQQTPVQGTPAQGTPAIVAPHLAGLAGDFFCAPFGDASADGAPVHGWTANARWLHQSTERNGPEVVARFLLERPVLAASVVKELRLIDDHPFLYQRHIFTGGQAENVAIANHAMIALPDGGRLSFSPKRWWESTPRQMESDPVRGRSLLLCSAKSDDLRAFPLADGTSADLTHYPFGQRHEDFVTGIEADRNAPGWTAVSRQAQGDLFLSLRNPSQLPMTHLWFSNGGRDYAPWSGRHVNCLGIEEGISRRVLGASANLTPNPLDAAGIAAGITLHPDGICDIRHITGCIPWAASGVIESVTARDGHIEIRDHDNSRIDLPFDGNFLKAGQNATG